MKMFKSLSIILLAAFLAIGCGSSEDKPKPSSTKTTTVSGTVLDAFGNPINGAEVVISSDPVTVNTDADGKFSATVEVGNHEIVIKKGTEEIYFGNFTCYENTPLSLSNIKTSYDPISADVDDDGDGYTENQGDCDDNNANTYPDASEICDGEDNNCNGTFHDVEKDQDGDGYFPCEHWQTLLSDCDDSNNSIHPGAAEICDDGVDNNCDGSIDETSACPLACTDNDNDGYSIEGGSCGPFDCNDSDDGISPGTTELCDDGVDQDCRGSDKNCQSNIIFVSSVSGTGDLSSWDDAGGNTGLAAGDAICQARADAAGLTGSFIAWLSDENDDAYCRIHGLTGKKDDNCEQAVLPVDAGPWEKIDGFPFGGTIDQLLSPNNVVYAPVTYDEYGNDAEAFYFTDTDVDGKKDGSHTGCENWTSNRSDLLAGGSLSDSTVWTSGHARSCDQTESNLLCMQPGEGTDQPTDDFDEDGYTGSQGDCDDYNANTYPGAQEICDGEDNNCNGSFHDVETDKDGDGYFPCEHWQTLLSDCNDNDISINPGAAEICGDSVDNNCDGTIDEISTCPVDCTDNDEDGYAAEGGSCGDVDCDDNNNSVNPGMTEICNDEIDNNCNGTIDETSTCPVCTDNDGDTFAIEGGSCGPVDCDDNNADTNPGASEICDGEDNNCNGQFHVVETDKDGDGYFPCEGDCDDSNNSINPGATEICGDSVDNNCDETIDEASACPVCTDNDGDGYGEFGDASCEKSGVDCKDDDNTIHPGADEECDGKDNNCDGNTDETGNALCDNGDYCDGQETCGGTGGCQGGSDPCASGETCNENTDACTGTNNNPVIVTIGDSITKGTGDDYLSDGRGYQPILSDLFSNSYDIVNAGEGGDTSEDGYNRIEAIVANNPGADRYLIMYGTNDTILQHLKIICRG